MLCQTGSFAGNTAGYPALQGKNGRIKVSPLILFLKKRSGGLGCVALFYDGVLYVNKMQAAFQICLQFSDIAYIIFACKGMRENGSDYIIQIMLVCFA